MIDTATGTIADNDDTPTLSIADAPAVGEGETATFAVTLNRASDRAVTAQFGTADGTAVAGADYTARSGTLTFAPGSTREAIAVRTLDDDVDEQDETFTVTLSNAVGADLDDATATGTIADNDDTPTLSIADAPAVGEGETATFAVTLNRASDRAVTVQFGTADGTAVAGADYTARSGTLTFAPGTKRATVDVRILDDDIDEQDETFTVTLSNAVGADLDDATATGTIADNDDTPTLSIADAPAVGEGETATFAVTLNRASDRAVTVQFGTADGTAVAGDDYTARSGTLTFAPGSTREAIAVRTLDDDIDEQDETFTVTLTAAGGAVLADRTATATIADNDAEPALRIADATVAEGATAFFQVTLGLASERTVTVRYRTEDGSAVAGQDFAPASGTLTFAPGSTRATIEVRTLGDGIDEPDETFVVMLVTPSHATLADGRATGTISDDDVRDLAPINQELLPELGRAVAFNAVRCRIEQAFSDMARGWAKPTVNAPPALAPFPETAEPGSLEWIEADNGTRRVERVFGNTSFVLPVIAGDGSATRFATWGCGEFRDLAGDSGGAAGAWEGEAFSMQVGADAIVGNNLLAGVSLSQSQGTLDFNGVAIGNDRADGRYDLQLTGVHPYLGWWVSPDLEIWGTVGFGGGELRVNDNAADASLASSATLASGTVGINGRLLQLGETTLRLKGEVSLAQLAVAKSVEALRKAAVNLQRLKLAAEIDHEEIVSRVGVLAPWGELGLRYDGGDGVTGASIEIGAGLHFRQIEQGWNAEVFGRWLVEHDDALPDEQGYGMRFRYDPGAPGFGPWVSLTQTWGETESGLRQLWEDGARYLTIDDSLAQRLDLEVGYGFSAFGGAGALTPFGAVSLESEDTRRYRIGGRLSLASSAILGIEVQRRAHGAEPARDAILIRGTARF